MRVAALIFLAGCDFIFTLHEPEDAVPAGCMGEIICPTDFVGIGTGTKYLAGSGQSWDGASNACVSLANKPGITGFTHLAVIDDEAELAAVRGLVGLDDVWIGLTDRKLAAFWAPVTLQPTSFPASTSPPWGVLEPSPVTDHCAAITRNTGRLDAVGCATTNAFICECDCFPDEPAQH